MEAAFIHCKNIRVAVKGTFAISLVGHFYYVAKAVDFQSRVKIKFIFKVQTRSIEGPLKVGRERIVQFES